MFATSSQDDEVPAPVEPVQTSAPFGYAAPVLTEAEHSPAVRGTVGANVIAAGDFRFYGQESEAVTRGAPVSRHRRPLDPGPRQLRAKDLIAELQAINAQIHQIMSQVERAVSRLATTA